jgi:gamma-glutamyltranspeptidase
LNDRTVFNDLQKLAPKFLKLLDNKVTRFFIQILPLLDCCDERKVILYQNKKYHSSLYFQENVKHPELADTLQVIADQGSAGFYTGSVAESIVSTVKNNSGILTLEDLKNYTAEIREPLSSDYKNYRIFTSGPPTSGVVLLSALNILEGFNLSQANRSDEMVYHYLVEVNFYLEDGFYANCHLAVTTQGLALKILHFLQTLKFVYAQRSRLADPRFVDLTNITDAMLSKQEAAKLRDLINISKTETNAKYYGPFFDSPPNKGTSHITVIDRKGGIVSVTR